MRLHRHFIDDLSMWARNNTLAQLCWPTAASCVNQPTGTVVAPMNNPLADTGPRRACNKPFEG